MISLLVILTAWIGARGPAAVCTARCGIFGPLSQYAFGSDGRIFYSSLPYIVNELKCFIEAAKNSFEGLTILPMPNGGSDYSAPRSYLKGTLTKIAL